MSDYLGMLAARYLNQGGSIRPEPVSRYEPPPPNWDLAVDAQGESPISSIAASDASFASPSGEGLGEGLLPLLPPASEAPSIPARSREASFTPSTSRGASLARSPSGEGSSIRSPASGDSTIPSRIRGVQVGVAETTAQTPPVDGAPLRPSPTGEASSIIVPTGTGHREHGRDVRAEPPIVGREVETVAGTPPPQPLHPIAAPRVVHAGSARAPSRSLAEGIQQRMEPPPKAIPSSPRTVAAPWASLPLIREETTEPPSLRVVPTLALPQPGLGHKDTHAPTLPSPRSGATVAAATGRDTRPDEQPIIEISIDEINIRAAPPPPAPATPRRERLRHPPMSLDDYLRRRSASR